MGCQCLFCQKRKSFQKNIRHNHEKTGSVDIGVQKIKFSDIIHKDCNTVFAMLAIWYGMRKLFCG